MASGKSAVLVPVATSIEPKCEAALRVLASRGWAVRTLQGCSQVDQARSELATAAFDDGFEETLWVDADIAFSPDDAERLRGHELPITAGLYTQKGPKRFAAKFLGGTSLKLGLSGGLVEVEYVGMGFVYVRREVYAACEKSLGIPRCEGSHSGRLVVPYFAPSLAPTAAGGMVYLADDYSFCHRARQCGFKVVVDTSIKLGHIGKYEYTWDDFAKQELTDVEITTSQES